jgi:opacity protein-like surface antigen
MKNSTTMLLTLTALATMGSSAVQAQLSNPWKFTIFAGAALPSGDSSDDLKTGYTVGGAVDLRAPLMPVGLRGELVYSSFDAKNTAGVGSASLSDLGGNLNAVFWFPSPGTPLTAYLTGGPSYAHLTAKASSGNVTESISDDHWGFNVGAGIDFALSGLSTRLDVRYRQISTGDGDHFKAFPITFGITF